MYDKVILSIEEIHVYVMHYMSRPDWNIGLLENWLRNWPGYFEMGCNDSRLVKIKEHVQTGSVDSFKTSWIAGKPTHA